MESMLLRTGSGSIPVQPPVLSGSPNRLSTVTLPLHECAGGGNKNSASSQMISMRVDAKRRSIRRSSSESDVMMSELKSLSRLGSRSFPVMIPEAEESMGSLSLKRGHAGELGFDGGGMNKNGRMTGGGGNGSGGDEYKIGAYYQQMLKSNPTNPLILRNYAKYLHEVEGDVTRAEEYYGRAILVSPGDGELLCSYGKLIWETYKDESRAKSYFQRALHALPHDCTVLGTYAQFLWEIEGEEDNEVVSTAAMVEAF